jgi:uncharacterized membrane protein YdjX (TVP38/TMEM64 family)
MFRAFEENSAVHALAAVRKTRWLVALIIATTIAAFFAFDLGRYLSFDYIQDQHAGIERMRAAHPLIAAAAFFALYVAYTGFSIPGAALMSLAAGAIFGLVWGTVIASFASTLGGTLAFLASRFLFREAVRRRLGERLRAVDRGVEKDGELYLFALRVLPVIPYFLVNLAMGLTPLRTWTFYWVSQLGTLTSTVVYVNAGTELVHIESPRDLFSPALLASLAALALLPIAAQKLIDAARARRSGS